MHSKVETQYWVPVLESKLPFKDPDVILYKRHGTLLMLAVNDGKGKGRVWCKRGWMILEGPWHHHFEYACESFKTFESNIQKRQAALYLSLRTQTTIPKDVIKMIVKKLDVYEGPFYGDMRPLEIIFWIMVLFLFICFVITFVAMFK